LCSRLAQIQGRPSVQHTGWAATSNELVVFLQVLPSLLLLLDDTIVDISSALCSSTIPSSVVVCLATVPSWHKLVAQVPCLAAGVVRPALLRTHAGCCCSETVIVLVCQLGCVECSARGKLTTLLLIQQITDTAGCSDQERFLAWFALLLCLSRAPTQLPVLGQIHSCVQARSSLSVFGWLVWLMGLAGCFCAGGSGCFI
jgi:hypothetical protein